MKMSQTLSRLGLEKPTLIGMSAILIWSSAIGLYRNIAEIFGPVGGAALTFTVSGIVAMLYAGRSCLRGHSARYLLLGGFFFVAYEISLALALGFANDRAQSIELGLINYLWPCVTIVLAVVLGDQRASLMIVPGVLLSLLGIFWVTSGGEATGLQPLLDNISKNPVAYALALAAAVTWPVYTLATRRMARGRNAVPLFLLTTAAVLWIKFCLTDQPPLRFDLEGALLVGGFGVITTLAYSAWNHGVMHGNLTLLASASYFTPVLSVLLSSLLFQVMPDANFWIGALLVTAGSLVCWWAVRTRTQAGN
jgi:drug/metabolite transporter (DMT)-like permease